MSPQDGISIGRVTNNGFDGLARTPAIPVLALVIVGLPAFVVQTWSMQSGLSPSATQLSLGWFLLPALADLFVALASNALLQGVVARMVIRRVSGRSADVWGSLAAALRMAIPLTGLSLLVGAITTIGMLMLIVPGVILYLVLIVAVPAMVAERTGVIRSMVRSEALTSGSKGSIFAIVLMLSVISFLLTIVVGLFGAVAIDIVGPGPIAPSLVGAVAATISSAITASIVASLYVELRAVKEGGGANALTEVFE